MSQRSALVTRSDFDRISILIATASDTDPVIAALDDKLSRATIVEPSSAPSDLVTMNTRFAGTLAEDGKPTAVVLTLVYPHAAGIADGRISVTTPLGAVLLAGRSGERVEWRGLDRVPRSFRIGDVLYQPESSGDWNL